MAARQYPLAKQVDGINLMRSKGGASPESLFDLKNGWVTSKRTIKARPGSVNDVDFPAGTKGVVGFEGDFHTFSHTTPVGVVDPNVVVHVLKHPTGGSASITKIHRAFPFLGRLYVVAEFSDGKVQHYWIENPDAWQATTQYYYGSVVRPTIDVGYYYENLALSAILAWQANTDMAINDYRQPRTANGFRYKVTAATGAAPYRTGNVEPIWPTAIGGTVTERRYITQPQVPPGSPIAGGGETPPTGGGAGGEYGPFPPYGDSARRQLE